jgi:hypothetical protein
MDTLRPIVKLKIDDVRSVVRDALQDESYPRKIAEFLGSVDWSHAPGLQSKIVRTLGQLEHWDTEYSEGDIDKAEYRKRLTTLLVDSEARRPRRSVVTA